MGNRYIYQTFKQWCIKNNRQDILDLWDYEKNQIPPSEVPAGTKNKYYFKCPMHIHDSELKRISTITDKPTHKIVCSQCGSVLIREDLTGQIFGNLTVLYFDEEKTKVGKGTYWVCKCSCGKEVSVLAGKLKSGLRASCHGKNRHIKEINENGEEETKSSILKRLRGSGLYQQWKKEVKENNDGKCIICGSTQNNEFHHIYPFASYPADRFNPNNGICLCKAHHNPSVPGSFHAIYGKVNNTPEQLQEYVNSKRMELGITEYFDVYDYMNDLYSDMFEIDDFEFD